MFCVLASLLLAATTPSFAESNVILRTAAEVNDFHEHKYDRNLPFEFEGDILHCSSGSYIVRDKTAHTWINTIEQSQPPLGSRARLAGIASYDLKQSEAMVVVTSAVVIGKAQQRPPVVAEIGKIDDRALNFCDITTIGTVIDAHDDEIDTSHRILLLKNGAAYLPVSFARTAIPDGNALVGARISVSGTFHRALRSLRKYSGPLLTAASFSVLTPPPADPFQAPMLKNIWYDMTPTEIAALDCRLAHGTVLAAWGGNRFVIRDAYGRKINVRLSEAAELPAAGDSVEVVGYPQTDLYRICLSYARWRHGDGASPNNTESAAKIDTDELMPQVNDIRKFESGYHGELVRLRGIVRSKPTEVSPEKRLYLDSGRMLVPVDCSACPSVFGRLDLGAEIEVSGRCIIETSEWSPLNVFPSARGFFIVAHSEADFHVIRNPAWWTPARFVTTLLVLLGILVAIFLWNLSLQVLVKRRARQIFKADLTRVTSELRVEDRTRLAVELHDALSQNLTGVSMEIEAATRYGTEEPENLMRHLQVADKVLKSCCTELRNSLWDLRNQALEEHDLNEAIRRTLLPHIKNVRLNVRFQVPRSRLTDNTTHEILHIIRELTVNGISHGGANEIRIAGSIEDETLLFSVRDNGTGFDPDTAPGVLQGHFGLKGVQDRLRRLSGKLELNSVIGEGTRAVVSLRLPQAQKKDSPS